MLDPAARRLIVAAALRLHVARRLGPHASVGDDLLATARRLRPVEDGLLRTYGLTFDPGYPGVTAGVEPTRTNLRLVLACVARHRGEPAGTVVTTLIAGRAPGVSVGPPEMEVPDTWGAPPG